MNAKIRLMTSEKKTEQGFPVKLVLYSEGKSRRKTISHADQETWDLKKNRPNGNHPDFENLIGICLEVEKMNYKMSFKNLTDFDEGFQLILNDGEIEASEKLDVYREFEKLLKKLEKYRSEDTIMGYNAALNSMKLVRENLSFEDFNTRFLAKWKVSLLENNMKHSSIIGYISKMKNLYNQMVDQNDIMIYRHPFRNLTKGLKINKYSNNRYLDDENLIKLIKLTASDIKPHLLEAARMSVLQFYFAGINLVDLFFLKRSEINNDRIYFQRKKLIGKSKYIDLKIFPETWEIMKELEAPGSSEYFFYFTHENQNYHNFYVKHRQRLLKIQEKYKIVLTPGNRLLTSNIMRHTFATRAKFQFVDVDLIRELMGHERLDVDTIYKDRFPESVRDQAHLKIITLPNI